MTKSAFEKTQKKRERALKNINHQKRLNPKIASMRIIGIYLIIGLSWIYFSDWLLEFFVTDPFLLLNLQTIKGWFYVLVTAGVFYLIIQRRLALYVTTIDGLDQAFFELDRAHQELLSFERQLHQVAYYDELTKLPAKSLLEKQTQKIIKEHKMNNQIFAFLYFDMDDFRHINEMYGYEAGDEVLKHITKEFQKHVQKPNFISRLNKDEFVAILSQQDQEQNIRDQIEDLTQKISKL